MTTPPLNLSGGKLRLKSLKDSSNFLAHSSPWLGGGPQPGGSEAEPVVRPGVFLRAPLSQGHLPSWQAERSGGLRGLGAPPGLRVCSDPDRSAQGSSGRRGAQTLQECP